MFKLTPIFYEMISSRDAIMEDIMLNFGFSCRARVVKVCAITALLAAAGAAAHAASPLPANNDSNCPNSDEDVKGNPIIVSCWGFGSGAGEFFFGKPDITSATITNKTVYITEQHAREGSIWVEVHATPLHFDAEGTPIYYGPFAAFQVASTNGNNLTSYALGLMLEMPTGNSVFNAIGLGGGYGWTQVHSLCCGFVAGNAPPNTSTTAVPLSDRDIGGWVIMLSVDVRKLISAAGQ